jgi:glycyl-tRNA synthetase beta chain
MSTVDVLIEVGFEEIPHRFLPDAVQQLAERFTKLLADAGLGATAVRADATPRRLVVEIAGCEARQADRSEELVGPPKEQAYKDGVPTKAAEGFAKKAGVPVEALRVAATDKGERVVAVREVAGRTAEEVLGELAPGVFESLPWPKNMRWGDGRRASVRPVHWVLALAGDATFPLEIFGVASGRMTHGHRTLHREPVLVGSVAGYRELLRAARVVVSRDERRQAIRDGLAAQAQALGGRLQEDPGLVEACCDLVEWPVVVAGEFPARYLELPGIVLSTAMRHHQKFFTLTSRGRTIPTAPSRATTAACSSRASTMRRSTGTRISRGPWRRAWTSCPACSSRRSSARTSRRSGAWSA